MCMAMAKNARTLHECEKFEVLLTAGLRAWMRRSERRPRLRIFTSEFHAKRTPPVKLEDYVARIVKYSNCSPVCFSVALVIMKRLAARYDEMIPISLNVHRILLVSILLAIKVSEDLHFDNLHFSKVGGLGLVELNALEIDMLRRLNFDLRVSAEEIKEAEASLIREVSSVPSLLNSDEKAALRDYGYTPEEEVARKRPASPLDRESAKASVSQEAFSDTVEVIVR